MSNNLKCYVAGMFLFVAGIAGTAYVKDSDNKPVWANPVKADGKNYLIIENRIGDRNIMMENCCGGYVSLDDWIKQIKKFEKETGSSEARDLAIKTEGLRNKLLEEF